MQAIECHLTPPLALCYVCAFAECFGGCKVGAAPLCRTTQFERIECFTKFGFSRRISAARFIVALRGDPPAGETRYVPTPGGYAWASELVAGLKARHDFEVSVATFPEGHPDSMSLDLEIDNLKRKIDAGATRAFTQFFFDNWTYLRFVDRARKAGITVPIVAGIMPVTNFAQMTKFAAMAGASVPRTMAPLFEGLEDDPETRKLVAVTVAADQCQKLAEAGVTEFHFYTLNRADMTYALCHILGLRPFETATAGSRPTGDGGRSSDATR